MKEPRLYQQLASAHQFGVARGGWNSLYLAHDHLLLRSSSGFTESYRRFYFADIEAITVCRTIRNILWNGAFALGIFFSGITLLGTDPPHIGSGICLGLFVLFFVVNLVRGGTCNTELQTRVQRSPLPLRHLRKALRVINQLQPKIQAAQADIVTAAPPAPAGAAQPLVRQELTSAAPPPLAATEAAEKNWEHPLTFALLIFAALIAIWVLGAPRAAGVYLCFLALILNLAAGITTLVRQRWRALPARPGLMVWISVTGHALAVPVIYTAFSVMDSVRRVELIRQHVQPAGDRVLGLSTLGAMPGFDYVLWGYAIFCGLIGLIGFVFFFAQPRPRISAPA